ncbi:hypothetical protein [Streptosporangium canum]|uniref:hypothetical protein n=1 Tax=Streptosporangium canum TaxID=324952 RepID=UPI0033B10D7F
MDFFTAPPPRVREQEKEREDPPWAGPPNDILGGVVPIEGMLFRSETLAIVLTSAVAFPAGVTIRLQMAARRVEGVNEDTWWDRHDLMFGHHQHRFRAEDSLPDEVVRFGVRFPDGSKATTVDGRADSGKWPPPRPEGPILKRSRGAARQETTVRSPVAGACGCGLCHRPSRSSSRSNGLSTTCL